MTASYRPGSTLLKRRRNGRSEDTNKQRACRDLKAQGDALDHALRAVLSQWSPSEAMEAALGPERRAQLAHEDGAQGDPYSPVVSRAIEAATRVSAKLRASRPEDVDQVARLLELPAGERWSQIATDGGLRRPEVVDLLLEAGRCIDSAHGDDEEVPLLALHLLERLDPEAQPDSLVGDLHCRALALRTEHLIRQRRRRAAEVAALRGRELLLESTDPLVALETGLAVALLGWAKGCGGSAFKLLWDLGQLASVLGDLDKAAEMALWCHLLLHELGDPELAAYMSEWAQHLLTAPLAEERLETVRAKYAWLRLGETAPTWEEKGESSRAAN